MGTKNYIVAIGGTGARCLEAVINLCAAGLFEGPVHTLLIDPDQTNGNAERVKNQLDRYHAISGCAQPSEPKEKRFGFMAKSLPAPVYFQVALNRGERDAADPLPHRWNDPNTADRKFREAIDFGNASDDVKVFAGLFYEEALLDMSLGKGYRGCPNVGAAVFVSDLRRTIGTPRRGLAELRDALRTDLNSADTVRVFVFGSVFGGTGAAGLPTIPSLLREAFEDIGTASRLRFGCAMMTPYFSFPKAKSGAKTGDGPVPDSDLHKVASQAALLHYADAPPDYQKVYIVGAPELPEIGEAHSPGGVEQQNDAHYAEVVAALAARDFFSLPKVEEKERSLRYADADHFGWNALPSRAGGSDTAEMKRRLVGFTTLAVLFRGILYDLRGEFGSQAWYRDNFARSGLDLKSQGPMLEMLNAYFDGYLKWLDMIGRTVGADPDPAFLWKSLLLTGSDAASQLGRLARSQSGGGNAETDKAYGRIVERVNGMTVSYANKVHPVGLLLYMLGVAVDEYCSRNYHFEK